MTIASDFKRILVKISGEALMGDLEYGHEPETILRIAGEIKQIYDLDKEICLVVGGGNIFRGVSAAASGMERASADYMGMLATIINALALQNSLENLGIATRVMSAIPMTQICESYVRRKAIRHMQKKRIVIFAAGTGNPFFTTDTAAALRAIEMGCDALFKGTNVDGVYNKDPKMHVDAKKYKEIDYSELLSRNLKVMDGSAISLARDNNLPVIVYSIKSHDQLTKIFLNDTNYTIIKDLKNE